MEILSKKELLSQKKPNNKNKKYATTAEGVVDEGKGREGGNTYILLNLFYMNRIITSLCYEYPPMTSLIFSYDVTYLLP